MNKKNYVTNNRNVKFYLDHGMRFKKIHRLIRFAQAAYMEPYTLLNTKMSTAPKNAMEKDFHKLMSNAVYGKTCENQRKSTDVHLINNRQKAAKLIKKPHCLDVRIFHETLLWVEMHKVNSFSANPHILVLQCCS